MINKIKKVANKTNKGPTINKKKLKIFCKIEIELKKF
jgi:hypothetical protein